jgi:deoxyribodipyrimidine photolyase-related protein
MSLNPLRNNSIHNEVIGIVFPHQLFEENILTETCNIIFLVEEYLFFKQYRFHKQKIAFHRASMKFYEDWLQKKHKTIVYIDALSDLCDIRNLITHLKQSGVRAIEYIDTTDNWLEKRISKTVAGSGIALKKHASPMFINTCDENKIFFNGVQSFFQTDFYKYQRKSKNILLEPDNKPLGGKWTFDAENRLKYPKKQIPPRIVFDPINSFYKEALSYTQLHFASHYGNLNQASLYPVTFADSKKWLTCFLQTRLFDFGKYEDAIVENEYFLHHSVLTPMLNSGLLTPDYVIKETLAFAEQHSIPLNSLEGFIRQITGWREFIRAVYELKGSKERTCNFWKFSRKIPESFWHGTTGIYPIDVTIKKVLDTGYCHHIERLMVLGNFMLLCEFDPDEVYEWFMSLFIDAYDWVMVPNIYGMSQFADGGLMSTKPYISGSNYLMKMSNFEKGEWQKIWDGLFWRFMHFQRDFFLSNPRLGMLVNTFDKMTSEKQKSHLQAAESFLKSL